MARIAALIRRGRHASGAVSAQLVQALTSLALQLVAVRELGAEGFGVFALIYSGVILATAISTGLVGDSLTVLDRQDRGVRAGLQTVGLAVAVLAGLVGAILAGATGFLDVTSALLLAGVLFTFILEDLVRRLLMAELRFWAVVSVDTTALVVTLVVLGAVRVGTGAVTLAGLLTALIVAQTVALVVGAVLVRPADRWLAGFRGAQVRTVLGFGGWRAAQQSVRPGVLTLARTVLVVAVGAAVFGELEAARVYTAPAMLLVNGIGGYLFASYAARRDRPLSELIHRADIGASLLVTLTLALGAAAVLVLPWAGVLVTGGEFEIDPVAVFGWSTYAAASATLMPYSSLAAVRGRHRLTLVVRLSEAVISLSVLSVAILVFDVGVAWAPYALSVGAILCGWPVRQWVLVRQAAEEARRPTTQEEPSAEFR